MTRTVGELTQKLGHEFTDNGILEKALTHSSATAKRGHSNERLEFLGDRVLGLVIAELLLAAHPGEEEGKIARRHTAAVRREALTRVAEDIGLGEHIRMAKGEEAAGGRRNPALLADCCEAVIAAIHRDGGLAAARAFIERHWQVILDATPVPPQDAKTALQEWAQGRGLALPAYREIGRQGPAHDPLFEVAVRIDGWEPETATGASKRAAEQAAAERLLKKLSGGDASDND